MKVGLVQCNFLIGDLEYNKRKILQGIDEAVAEGAELVVFSELAITGYPPQDLLQYSDFIVEVEAVMNEIAAHCTGVAAVIGAPGRNMTGKGKPLFNSAWFLFEGKVQAIVHKSLLPDYDVFDEYRYFEPANSFGYVDYKGKKLVLTICEDIWNTAGIPMYSYSPLNQAVSINPDIIINISASPYNYNQAALRQEVIRQNALKYGKPIVYVNQTGANTEIIFDGNSMVCDAFGRIRNRLECFAEQIMVVDIDHTYVTPPTDNLAEASVSSDMAVTFEEHSSSDVIIKSIHDALVLGIRDYFAKMGFSKAILGLSGGIDSAVTMALAARAIGAENVLGVLLPSKYSSEHSIDDAIQLAVNLKSPYTTISIREGVAAVEETLKPEFADMAPGLTEENIQARMRAVMLMAMSNKFGYILLNTSNKSEAAVGYGTLYGDMCGGLSVLGDVYKTDVYKLAGYINKDVEIIPLNTIVKPPSAELRPDQKDSDLLPEYDLLDQILYAYIEMQRSPKELILMGFETTIVNRVVRMVNRSEWKRFQSPPVLRVSPKAFGAGRRMPIAGRYF